MERPDDLPRFRTLDSATREILKRIPGRPTDGDSGNDADHFYKCDICSQPVDRRSLYEVVYHDDQAHPPLSEAELSELAR